VGLPKGDALAVLVSPSAIGREGGARKDADWSLYRMTRDWKSAVRRADGFRDPVQLRADGERGFRLVAAGAPGGNPVDSRTRAMRSRCHQMAQVWLAVGWRTLTPEGA
jgi:hypothetical protein